MATEENSDFDEKKATEDRDLTTTELRELRRYTGSAFFELFLIYFE